MVHAFVVVVFSLGALFVLPCPMCLFVAFKCRYCLFFIYSSLRVWLVIVLVHDIHYWSIVIAFLSCEVDRLLSITHQPVAVFFLSLVTDSVFLVVFRVLTFFT